MLFISDLFSTTLKRKKNVLRDVNQWTLNLLKRNYLPWKLTNLVRVAFYVNIGADGSNSTMHRFFVAAFSASCIASLFKASFLSFNYFLVYFSLSDKLLLTNDGRLVQVTVFSPRKLKCEYILLGNFVLFVRSIFFALFMVDLLMALH